MRDQIQAPPVQAKPTKSALGKRQHAMPPPVLSLPSKTSAETDKCCDAERGAAFLRDGICAVALTAAVDKNVATAIPISSFQVYRDALLSDLGHQADPLEVMLAEQLAVAHHTQLRLQARVGQAASAEECHLLASAACQTMAEFRRSAVVFRESRGHVTKQAAGPSVNEGHGNLGADQAAPGESVVAEIKSAPITKKASIGGIDLAGDVIVPFKKPAPRRRRKVKSA